MYWNAKGVRLKIPLLRKFLEDHRIDITLLTEIHLRPFHRCTLPNYTIFRNDRPVGSEGSTAIAIKS